MVSRNTLKEKENSRRRKKKLEKARKKKERKPINDETTQRSCFDLEIANKFIREKQIKR